VRPFLSRSPHPRKRQERVFWRAAARPEFQSVLAAGLAHGLQERSPLEYHLGEEVANIALTGAPSRSKATVS
jgi:hypothetical protein